MSAYVKGKGLGQEEARVHRIRITLTSKNVKNLEKGKYSTPPQMETSCIAVQCIHIRQRQRCGSVRTTYPFRRCKVGTSVPYLKKKTSRALEPTYPGLGRGAERYMYVPDALP